MAHNIQEHDSLLLAKDKAWHGMGKILPEAFTVEDAMQQSGLDWEVNLVPIQTVPLIGGPNDGAKVMLEDHRAVVRSDTGEVFAVVGSRYQPIQNSQLIYGVNNAVSSIIDKPIKLESCGSFKNGRLVFVSTELMEFEAAKGDLVKAYCLFSNSHDGTTALQAGKTSVRVVCNNTLNFALEEIGKKAIRARHTPSILLKYEEIVKQIVLGVEAAKQFETNVRKLAKHSLHTSKVQEMYEMIYVKAIGKPEDERASRKAVAVIEDWKLLLAKETNTLGNEADNSLWAIFNSVTEWSDHHRTVRSEDQDPSRRMQANLFGDSAKFKDRVWDAVQLVTT